MLMHYNIDIIRRMAATVPAHDARSTVDAAIRDIEKFLRFAFDKHIGMGMSASHNIQFSLAPSTSHQCDLPDRCSTCTTPFEKIDVIKGFVDSQHHAVLDDCSHKFHLYMAHRMRVANQRSAIAELLRKMHLEQQDDHAHVHMDYKMKFEPMYHAEKTLQHYGKRGQPRRRYYVVQ
jgi:hypothetical protein